jgi:hypothetical protein
MNVNRKIIFFLFCVFSYSGIANAQVTVSGSNGADATYTKLALAFTALNGASQTGRNIIINITASTTETTAATLNSGAWTSINIYPTISGVNITGNLASPLIDLNGADNVTIDGRVNASGSTVNMTVTNSSTSSAAGTATIRFINDATNNTIKYCNIKGSATDALSGIIFFSTTTGTTGNDANLINNNNITNSTDANRPINALFSAGTVAKENSGNIISNNNIYDFLNRASISYGINLGSNTTAWTISGNSFYETASFTPTASVAYCLIQINNTSGINFIVTSNYIGGKAPLCGSTAWTKTNSQDNNFTAIYLNVGTGTASSVQNNLISNINWSNSGAGSWSGINVAGGDVNIGTITGNTIGATTGTGSVTLSGGATNANLYAISFAGNGIINCQNNIIGSITTANTNVANATNIFGINRSNTGLTLIGNNIIGSTTTANSINASSASNGNGLNQNVYGIYNSGTGSLTINANTIVNLVNNTSNARTGTPGLINGITSSAGTNIITNNTIHNLSIANRNTSTSNTAAVCGIALTGNTLKTVTGNSIYSLSNSYASFAGNITGIYFTGNTGVNVVAQNFIYGLSVTGATSTGASIYGIKIASGACTYSNNIINLGGNTRTTLYGIYETGIAGNDNNLYFNTIYINGTLPAGATNRSYALYSAVNTNTRNFRNNILMNARSTVGGANRHYAIYIVTAAGTITCNYNDYSVTGSGGTLGYYSANRTVLPVVSGQDANSKAANPAFSLPGGISSNDYIPSNTTLLAVTGTGITIDYISTTRSITYPAMGAFEIAIVPSVEVFKSSVLQAGYSTLKNAFDAINAGIHNTGALEIRINNSTNETASAILNASGSGSANYTSVLIYPTTSGIIVSGNLTAPLIDLNGADNVIIDGRVNATGLVRDMTITNTSTSATAGTSTIRFINDASNNILRYCTLKGSNTVAGSGILFFSTTTQTTGNDGNTVDNNNITSSADANRPLNAIYSSGTSLKENSGNSVSNNNFYDFLSRSTASNGINLGANTTNWTINANSFYETASFIPTASVAYIIIQINNTSGINFTVSGNYIGGKAALCGGTAWTKTNAQNNSLSAISINAGTATASNVQNNTIQNIVWSNSSTASWTGINIAGGDVNIGTTARNIIGSSTGTGSVTLTAGANSAYFYGINIASTGNVQCQNNIIGSITVANSSSNNATNFYGINRSSGGGTANISSNTIGSYLTANSIEASSTSSSNGSNQLVFGISNSGTGTLTISSNTIANIKNGTTNSNNNTSGLVNGISSAGGTNTIASNTIRDLTTANNNTNTDNTASVSGIALSGTTTVRTVTGNTIYNLSNTYASFAGNVVGIYFAGNTGANVVSQNFIHSLSVTGASSTSASVYGIKIAAGATTYYNNIINLGGNTRTTIFGIYETGAGSNNNNLYFNTVYIGGSLGAGVTNLSYALYSAVTTNTRNFRNNIFNNSRSTTGGASLHYAAYFNYATGSNLTLNYNDYFAPGTGGVLGYYGGSNKIAVPLVPAQDGSSLAINPVFSNQGGTLAINYYSSANLPGIAIAGITTDYFGENRNATPKMGALETQNYVWQGNLSTDFATAGNWSGGIVPPNGSDISFAANPSNHCFLDQNRTLRNITNTQGTDRLVLNAKQLTLTGNIIFSGGAQIDASAVSSVIIFSGSTTQVIPSGCFFSNVVAGLTINNTNNVSLYGSLILTGSVTSISGRLDAYTNTPSVEYGSGSSLTIPDGIFLDSKVHSLIINNNGVTLNADFIINNSLSINSGKSLAVAPTKTLTVPGTITNSAGNSGLILKSDASGTASLIHNTNNVPATIQRYINGVSEDWHFLSSPVSNQAITGSWLPSGTYGNSTGYDLYVWDEPSNCWIYYLNTTSAVNWNTVHPGSSFVSGRGYLYSVQAANPTKEFAGMLNNGTVTYGITADSPDPEFNGFNLVGNPYPSSIDWYATSGWTRSNLLTSGSGYDIWIWNPSANNYGVYNSDDISGIGTNGAGRYIAPMQGFFVRAESTGDLGFSNSVRVLNGAGNWLKKGEEQENYTINITINSNEGYGFDEVQIKFGSLKNNPGAIKLFSHVKSAPSLYLPVDNGDFSIRYLTDTIENSVVPLMFKSGKDGEYTLNCSFNTEKFKTLILEDYQNHYFLDLKINSTYSFKSSTSDNKARFVVHFTPVENARISELPAVIYNSGNRIIVDLSMISGETELRVYDLMGCVLIRKDLQGETRHELNLNLKSQMLIVCLKNQSGNVCRKLMWIN